MFERFHSTDQRSDEYGCLNPAMLIAATINTRGNIDLPMVENGAVAAGAGVEFGICGDGEVVQQGYRVDRSSESRGSSSDIRGMNGEWHGVRGPVEALAESDRAVRRLDPEPLDMILLASGLTHVLERHTPPLFRLKSDSGGGRIRLACEGEAFDHRRIRLLHDAFAIHILAYEERLV